MTDKILRLGQDVKVHLRGENPWATVKRVVSVTQFVGEINNDLVGPLHKYKRGDLITFEWDYSRDTWEPHND